MRQQALLMPLAVVVIAACAAAPPADKPPSLGDTNATPQPKHDDNAAT